MLTNPTANYIELATSASLGNAFHQSQLSHTEPQKTSGGVRMAHDSAGRRHVIWWQQEGAAICDYYARIEADGRVSIVEKIPATCGQRYKNTALAVGADNRVHALFGQNLISVLYWSRTDAGWDVQAEGVPGIRAPENMALGVTTGGVIIASWQDIAPKNSGNTDIYAATRRSPNSWDVEDVSLGLTPGCPGDSSSYLPSMAADHTGGMRLVWSDERCDPRSVDPPDRDIYYREWTPGPGWSDHLPVRAGRHAGGAFASAVTVDASGKAHIVWAGTQHGNGIGVWYVSGRGTSFTQPAAPFDAFVGTAYAKDVAVDFNNGYLYVAFTSTRDDPEKEVYYSFLQVGPTNAPPPPTPTPATVPTPGSGPSVPGAGSRTFAETGKTVTGIFLQYWDTHGGLVQQGFPISNVMLETSDLNHKQYLVQYFERTVFEYHPENAPPYNVLLSQMGRFRYLKRYAAGAPNQRVNPDPGQYFPETGHKIGGSFWVHWRDHGGLSQQGYPLTDEVNEVSQYDGKPYVVQYFERSVFEWHPANQPPYNVLLSLLGVLQFREKYGVR